MFQGSKRNYIMINGKCRHIVGKSFYFCPFTLLKFNDFQNQSLKFFYEGSSDNGRVNEKNRENIFIYGEPRLFEREINALGYKDVYAFDIIPHVIKGGRKYMCCYDPH